MGPALWIAVQTIPVGYYGQELILIVKANAFAGVVNCASPLVVKEYLSDGGWWMNIARLCYELPPETLPTCPRGS